MGRRTPKGTPPGAAGTTVGGGVATVPARSTAVELPGARPLRPHPVIASVVTAGTVASFVVSAVRPKGLPPTAQRLADRNTAVILGLHPVEALVVRRWAGRRGVDPSVRRRATFSTLMFGVFSAPRVIRAIRRG